MKASFLFLAWSAFLFLGRGVSAIRCYDCNSAINSLCAKANPPDALKKDCAEHVEGAKYTMCRKITQSIEFSVNGLQSHERVIRNCGWDESAYKNKCYQRGGFGGRQEVCSCSSDLCNAATPAHTAAPHHPAMIVSLLIGSAAILGCLARI